MDSDTFNITKVKDGFFLGDEMTATNYEVLINFKISHMINAAGPQIRNAWENLNIKYLTLNWNESPTQHLFDPKDEIANRIVSFIDDSYKSGEGFLVHSVRGQNRACLVVLIYFIRKFRWSLRKSLEFLTSKKSDIDIPQFFSNQISNFETRLTKYGVGPKSNCWSDVGTGMVSDIDNEEVVIRNTYLNGSVITNNDIIYNINNEYKNPYTGNYYNNNFNKTKIKWSDHTKLKAIAIEEDIKDLYLINPKYIKPITVHKFKKPLKSCLKSSNIDKQNEADKTSTVKVRPGTSGNERKTVYRNNLNNSKDLSNYIINENITKDDTYVSKLKDNQTRYKNKDYVTNTNNDKPIRSASYVKSTNNNNSSNNNQKKDSEYIDYNKLNYDFIQKFDLTKGLSQGYKPVNNINAIENNYHNYNNKDKLSNNINNYINNNLNNLNKQNNNSNASNNYMTFGSTTNVDNNTVNYSKNSGIKSSSYSNYAREKMSNNNNNKHHNHNFLREDSTKKNRMNNNLSHSMKTASGKSGNNANVIKNDYFNNNNNNLSNNIKPIINKEINMSNTTYSNYISKNVNRYENNNNNNNLNNYNLDNNRIKTPQTNNNNTNSLNNYNISNIRPGTADNKNSKLNSNYDIYENKFVNNNYNENTKIVSSPMVQDLLNKPIKKINNNSNSGVSTSDYSFNNNLTKNEKDSTNLNNNLSTNSNNINNYSHKLEKNKENQRILNNNYFNNNAKDIVNIYGEGSKSFKLNSNNNILNINERPGSGGIKKTNSKPTGKVTS